MKYLKNLSISQLIQLSQRFDLNPTYKNPQKRAAALRRCLHAHWKDHPIGECSICWEEIPPNKLFVTPCAHLFCVECLLPYVRQSELCPLCRGECSYVYFTQKLFQSPELVVLLKQCLPQIQEEEEEQEQQEQQEQHEHPENDQEQTAEETRVAIYHVNIYIILQRSIEKIHSLTSIYIATFFAYYYYLHFLRRGVNAFYIIINMLTIYYVIYYGLS